jgi:hypothetical protein
MVPLDPVGNISLIFQMIALFLLILGLPAVSRKQDFEWAPRHGYLTLGALVLHTALIFIVMVPVFMEGIPEIGEIPVLWQVNVVSHVILGIIADVLGWVIVLNWLIGSPKKMKCVRFRTLMTPLFIIWTISVINGAILHIIGML